MPQTITDGALPWQRLALVNKHPRDDRIEFEEETHTYTIDGMRNGWVSCTGFLHQFFAPFNADATIAKMMASSRWTDSKYYGMTADEIKRQWSDKGKASSEAGTRMHLDIEHFYNALPAAWNSDEKKVDVETGLQIMQEQDNWIVAGGAEWNYFKEYQTEVGSKFIPFRTEWLVFDEEHQIAGSIDMVYQKPDGTLAIYDWKRIEEVKFENRFQSGLGPVKHLPDTNFWHYSIQLNVYRYILEKHYGYKVSEMALVVLHPTNKTWIVKPIQPMDEEIAQMLKTRSRALERYGRTGDGPQVVLSESDSD